MDLTESIVPKSDQLNAEDLLTGPRTFTIDKVSAGSVEQPVDVHLTELPGRAYRPSKTMRRVMVMAWGKESSAYTGHRLTLFRDPEVTFGRDKVGGIKISHLSHIEKRLPLMLTVTRGKRAMYVIEPLVESARVVDAVHAAGVLLNEIGALADKLPGGRKIVATEWAESHEGQSLRDATDLGGLELLRNDLAERAAS